MPARLDSVAKHLCAYSGWSLSNLHLHKLIYLAQMDYMGTNNGLQLVDANFEAWDLGPVIAPLYHKLKAFGSAPVKDVFLDARLFKPNDSRARALEQIYDCLKTSRPGALIELTHWEGGAWAKNYIPGIKGILIPNDDIHAEYRLRKQLISQSHPLIDAAIAT